MKAHAHESSMASAWLGVLVRDGPKILEKTAIEVVDNSQTVGASVSQIVTDDYKVLSVLGHRHDPEKPTTIRPTSLPLSVPLSAAIQSGVTHFKIKTENSEERDTLTSARQLPPENGLDVLIMMSRSYKSWLERLGGINWCKYVPWYAR